MTCFLKCHSKRPLNFSADHYDIQSRRLLTHTHTYFFMRLSGFSRSWFWPELSRKFNQRFGFWLSYSIFQASVHWQHLQPDLRCRLQLLKFSFCILLALWQKILGFISTQLESVDQIESGCLKDKTHEDKIVPRIYYCLSGILMSQGLT